MQLDWTGSTDNVGVTGYEIERCTGDLCTNFSLIGMQAFPQYFDFTVLPLTTYRYQVRAFDAVGGVSDYSNIATATTPSGFIGSLSIDATFTYDQTGHTYGIGRLTSVSAAAEMSFDYDERGNVTHTVTSILGTDYPVTRTYDSLNRVVDLTYPDPDREVVRHYYHPQGVLLDRVASVTYGIDYVKNLEYNEAGQVIRRELGNGLVTTYTYADANTGCPLTNNYRLCTITTGSLQDLTYTYDAVGNVVTITDTVVGPATQTFGYDDLHRLSSVSSPTAPTYTYDYDTIGNFTTAVGSTYTYPLPGFPQPHAPTSDGQSNYFYDPNGNLATKTTGGTTHSFSWDELDRLVKIEDNGPPAVVEAEFR